MMPATIVLDDQVVMQMAKDCLHAANSQGNAFGALPVLILQLLIEKAERPHD